MRIYVNLETAGGRLSAIDVPPGDLCRSSEVLPHGSLICHWLDDTNIGVYTHCVAFDEPLEWRYYGEPSDRGYVKCAKCAKLCKEVPR